MKTRRSFFKQLAFGVAAFGILPAATTYERIWKPKLIIPAAPELMLNPDWVNAPCQIVWLTAPVLFNPNGNIVCFSRMASPNA